MRPGAPGSLGHAPGEGEEKRREKRREEKRREEKRREEKRRDETRREEKRKKEKRKREKSNYNFHAGAQFTMTRCRKRRKGRNDTMRPVVGSVLGSMLGSVARRRLGCWSDDWSDR